MKKSELKQIIKEEIFKSLNQNTLSESQQLQSLKQQAKDFVSKYGKVKVKI